MTLQECLKISKETGQDFFRSSLPRTKCVGKKIPHINDIEAYWSNQEVMATDWQMIEEKIEMTRHQIEKVLSEMDGYITREQFKIDFLQKLGFKS